MSNQVELKISIHADTEEIARRFRDMVGVYIADTFLPNAVWVEWLCAKHGPHPPGECPKCDELAEARSIVATSIIPPDSAREGRDA